MIRKKRLQFSLSLGFIFFIFANIVCGADNIQEQAGRARILNKIEIEKDIIVVLGLPNKGLHSSFAELIEEKELIVYFQSPDLND